MQVSHLSKFETGSHLHRRPLRAARRRRLLTIAIVATTGISAFTFAAGIAVGIKLADADLVDHHCSHHAGHEDSGGPDLAARDTFDAMLPTRQHKAKAQTVAWEKFPGRPPVHDARIGSSYGNRVDPFKRRTRFHSGIDFVANKGTPIRASASGRVSFAGRKAGYGNLVEIDHGNGLVTRYGHASRLVVRRGDEVTSLQHVADVGSTGRSTGPHLHFELLKNGEYIDPAGYLETFARDSGNRELSASLEPIGTAAS
jgi:murein DD-endopeptidase MepM/ murein hydrolase activator NlpD